MANRTAKDAHSIRGTNPQYLVEKIIRTRIYDSLYWKESCFALSADTVIDRAVDLRFVGGIYAGNIKPTPFLCLLLKLLQLQPEKEIIIEYIRQEDFKYLRALGAFYIRLTFNSVEVYRYLEPLYNDYRKLRFMNKMGKFELLYFDDFIDNLLREESYFDIQLHRLAKRQALEETDQLELYQSALDEEIEKMSSSDSEDEKAARKEKHRIVSRRRSRSRSRGRSRSNSRERRRRSPGDSRHSKHASSSSTSRNKNEGLSIDETNALRKKMGLAPLEP